MLDKEDVSMMQGSGLHVWISTEAYLSENSEEQWTHLQ